MSGPDRATKRPTIDHDHDGKIRLISTLERSSQGTSITAWGIWYAPDNARLYHHPLRYLGCWPTYPGLIIESRVQPKLPAFQGLIPSFLPLRRREEKKTAWLDIVLVLYNYYYHYHWQGFDSQIDVSKISAPYPVSTILPQQQRKTLSTLRIQGQIAEKYTQTRLIGKSFKLNRRDGGPNWLANTRTNGRV